MKDYYYILDHLKRTIGTIYAENKSILNIPGHSLACKIDPFYYLAPLPLFLNILANWSGYLPKTVQETLLTTGNIVSTGKNKKFSIKLDVRFAPHLPSRSMNCCLVLADFIDSSLKIYALQQDIPPVSDLKVMSYEQDKLKDFLADKTEIQALAFTR